jgi:hypothetical protein
MNADTALTDCGQCTVHTGANVHCPSEAHTHTNAHTVHSLSAYNTHTLSSLLRHTRGAFRVCCFDHSSHHPTMLAECETHTVNMALHTNCTHYTIDHPRSRDHLHTNHVGKFVVTVFDRTCSPTRCSWSSSCVRTRYDLSEYSTDMSTLFGDH